MAPDTTRLRRIRWLVRATLTLGVAASVTANVLHAQPNPIASAIAAWPPLALLLTVELISRVPIHRRTLAAVRFLATGAIAGIAAWVSYWHMAGVAARYGESFSAAHLIPLSVDGLVVVASVSLVELAGRLRDATLPTDQPADEPVNPAPPPAPPPAPEPQQSRDEPQPQPTREIDPAAHRAAAVAALLQPGADPAAIAGAAGVTVETLQRWADRAASAARRARGGRTKTADKPTERELVGASVAAGSDFPADPATTEEG